MKPLQKKRKEVIIMTRVFTLEGLDCANCASKIEKAINEMAGVVSASVTFSTAKLQMHLAPDYSGDIAHEVQRVIHAFEPDVLVVEKADTLRAVSSKNSNTRKILWLSAGALTFALGIVFEWTDVSFYLMLGTLLFSYLLLGARVIIRSVRNISKGQIFDENFLMSIATIGAFFIGEYSGAVAVMLFYQVGEFFQELAVAKSKRNISDLMDIRPDYANLLVDGESERVSPETVQVGSLIIVKPGEKIPLDGVIIEGDSLIDNSALTGESALRKAGVSDTVLSGSINQSGVLTVEVTQTFGDSTASKIIDLVENAASKKAKVETFITKFAKFYTPIVVILAVLIAIVPPLLFGASWSDWIHRSLVLLIISCPCALVLSIPLGFFGGIGAASKKGILVKGGNYLEALAHLDYVVFDKTGTLTKGVFKITSKRPANGFTDEQLLESAAFAEVFSSHPIAVSIMSEYGKELDTKLLSNYEEISGHGVSVTAGDKSILVGNGKLMELNNIEHLENNEYGTTVHVAVNSVYAGCIIISDEIKPDSRDAIANLKAMGVSRTIMLTGDIPSVAHAVAEQLELDEVHASLLPQDKVSKVEELGKLKNSKKSLAFVGDGINDAPVLAMADVGIAMGGLGSDAAIEAADVVLMTDEPSKLVEAVKTARFTRRIVWQNIVFTVGVQVVFIVLGTMGIASIWEAIFADVGVALIAVLNTLRILRT